MIEGGTASNSVEVSGQALRFSKAVIATGAWATDSNERVVRSDEG